MLARTLALGLLTCSFWVVVAAPGCTDGTTPNCDAGCGASVDEGAPDVSPETLGDVTNEN
jgi:hypothetical protein